MLTRAFASGPAPACQFIIMEGMSADAFKKGASAARKIGLAHALGRLGKELHHEFRPHAAVKTDAGYAVV